MHKACAKLADKLSTKLVQVLDLCALSTSRHISAILPRNLSLLLSPACTQPGGSFTQAVLGSFNPLYTKLCALSTGPNTNTKLI